MKKLITLLLASSLVGCKAWLHHADHYHALLKGSDLGCCIVADTFHNPPQALKLGTSNLAGEVPVLQNTPDAALGMMLRAPPPAMPQGATMGIFLPGLNLGKGTDFSVSATFRRPSTVYSEKNWAVGVVARTGDFQDLADLMRLQLTFRILKSAAELRVQEQWGPDDVTQFKKLAARPVPAEVYKKIVDGAQPFTLKLSIDRRSGSGTATMTSGGETFSVLSTTDMTRTFTMAHFTKDGGEPLTVLGATLANPSAPGEERSVEVSDFEVWRR